MDEADRTFKWVCPKCRTCLEENDPCTLEVRIQRHKCKKELTSPVRVSFDIMAGDKVRKPIGKITKPVKIRFA